MLALYFIVLLQIILESLPISSSGHIILLENVIPAVNNLKIFLGLPCYKALDHLLHLPTVFVFLIFIIFYLKESLNKFKINYIRLISFIALADLTTVCIYFFKRNFTYMLPIWIGFIITLIINFFAYKEKDKSDFKLSFNKAILLGLAQGVAFLPGVSRLAITFLMARFTGFLKEDALFISLLMAIPLFIAGSTKGFICIMSSSHCYNYIFKMKFFISIILASLLAFLLLVCLKWLINHNKYWVLSIYMLVPILISIFL